MPLLQINAGPSGPELHGSRRSLRPVLEKALRGNGPIIIMLHGYKFAPGHETGCPHAHILSLTPRRRCWKALSWPRELGFGAGRADEGLAIAFGWPARGTIWQAYRRAERAAFSLACLISMIRRVAPDRPVHLLAHSLGARVVLGALPLLPSGSLGRAILLNGAEFGSRARLALNSPAGRSTELINVTSRENDLFDFLLERLLTPPEPGDRMLSQVMPCLPNTLTLQIDNLDTLSALAASGYRIAPSETRVCHWSAYLRSGVFDFYSSLLREDRRLALPALRAVLPERTDPRWSRVFGLPDIRLPGTVGRKASP